jgi:hypothetical protein
MTSRRGARRKRVQRQLKRAHRSPKPALITARTAAVFGCGSLTASATPSRSPKIRRGRPRWWPGLTGKGALTATAHPVPEVLAGKDESPYGEVLPDIAAQLAERDAKWKRLRAEGLTYAAIAAADGSYSASTVYHVLKSRQAPKKKPLTTKLAGQARGTGTLTSQTDSPPFVVVSFTTASDKAGMSDRLNRADAEAEAAKIELIPGVIRTMIVDTRASGSHRNDPISAGIDRMIAALHAEAARGQAERRRAARRDEDGTDEIAGRAILDTPPSGPRGGGRPAYSSHRWPNPADNPWLNLDWDVQLAKLRALLAELYEGASTHVKEPV